MNTTLSKMLACVGAVTLVVAVSSPVASRAGDQAATSQAKASTVLAFIHEWPQSAQKPAASTQLAFIHEWPQSAQKPAASTQLAFIHEWPQNAQKPATSTQLAFIHEWPQGVVSVG